MAVQALVLQLIRVSIRFFQKRGPMISPDFACSNTKKLMTEQEIFVQAARQHEAGNLKQARTGYEKVLELNSRNVHAWHLLGHLLLESGQNQEALECLVKACELEPENAELQISLGRALAQSGRFSEACKIFSAAAPILQDPEIWELLGRCAEADLKIQDAIGAFSKALKLDSSRLGLMGRMGYLLLYAEEIERGFNLHRFRSSVLEASKVPLGSEFPSVRRQRIHLNGEQGLGDELFFLRYLPVLEKLGPKEISVLLSPKNQTLIARILPELKQGNPGPDSLVLELGDLPHICIREGFREIPAPLFMGSCDPSGPICVQWEAGAPQIAMKDATGVGKRVDPFWLGTLLQKTGKDCVVLQRNPKPEDLLAFEKGFGKEVENHSSLQEDLILMHEGLQKYSGYAGVSSTAWHMASGMDMPGLICVPHPADFRWGLRPQNTIWFKTATLIRQNQDGSWPEGITALQARVFFR